MPRLRETASNVYVISLAAAASITTVYLLLVSRNLHMHLTNEGGEFKCSNFE